MCDVATMFKSNQGLVNRTRNARNHFCEMAIFWSTFDQLHSLGVDRFRFGVAVKTESEGRERIIAVASLLEAQGFMVSALPSISVSGLRLDFPPTQKDAKGEGR